ncbi:hypothetical protein G7046_g3272 [Stylonectria norvegica]|nr:hypothetical protein G7046_g3272 [Stylonectria norvegica]
MPLHSSRLGPSRLRFPATVGECVSVSKSVSVGGAWVERRVCCEHLPPSCAISCEASWGRQRDTGETLGPSLSEAVVAKLARHGEAILAGSQTLRPLAASFVWRRGSRCSCRASRLLATNASHASMTRPRFSLLVLAAGRSRNSPPITRKHNCPWPDFRETRYGDPGRRDRRRPSALPSDPGLN